MSREFGDYRGGMFFHDKVESAYEDATGGSSVGSKLMANFLKPLSEIAYAVSSQEACDSGESYVVDECQKNYEELQTAMYAIKHYLDPAIELAAQAMSETIRYEVVPQKSPNILEIRVWRGFAPKRSIRYWDILNKAMEIIARKQKGSWHRTGLSSNSSHDYETWTFSTWDSASRASALATENQKLRERIAFLEAIKQPLPEAAA